MSLYVGINNGIEMEVGNLFVGVNGMLKEVVQLCVGVDGLPKTVYTNVNVDRDIHKINPIKLLESGKITKDDIGKTVYLSNTYTYCQEWIIAGVNHDMEDGSVDLVPKYVLKEGMSFGGRIYWDSDLRKWLNNTFIEGFNDDIRNALVEIPFLSHINSSKILTLTDKVKTPNATELGVKDQYYGSATEGEKIYPLYGNSLAYTNAKAIMTNMAGTAVDYYTRVVYNSDSTVNPICINEDGAIKSYGSSGSVMAIIRFKQKKNELDIETQLAMVNPIELLTSGKLDKSYIGRTVHISNTKSECQNWIIADIDHDNTGYYSIDLISDAVISANDTFGWYSDTDIYYYNSDIRSVFLSMLEGFSYDTRKHLGIFSFNNKSHKVHDVIKCPSFAELGINSFVSDKPDGTIYPLFGSVPVDRNTKVIRSYNGTNVPYWVRDEYSGSSAYCITNIGRYSSETFRDYSESSMASTYLNSVGMIRFIKRDEDASVDYILNNAMDPVDLLISGRITRDDIGKTVCLYNSKMPKCYEWIIADIDHDGTTGTIDLISKGIMYYNVAFGYTVSGSGNRITYNTSNMMSKLQAIYDGFAVDVRSILTTMDVKCDGNIISNKVKLLSLAELGYVSEEYNSTEGTKYPIFNSKNDIIALDGTDHPVTYWLRNTYIGASTSKYEYAMFVTKNGGISADYWYKNSDSDGGNPKGLRVAIRVKVK